MVTLRDIELMIPPELPVYFWRKWFVRYIMFSNTGLYKLVAYNPTTCKVRSLTQFNKIKLGPASVVRCNDAMVEMVEIGDRQQSMLDSAQSIEQETSV